MAKAIKLNDPNFVYRSALKAETYARLKHLHAYYTEKSFEADTFCGFDLEDLIHWVELELQERRQR